jgi:capsular polysaccharide biosynthesis protein
MEASSELGGYSGQMLILGPAFKPTTPLPPGKATILAGALGAALVLAILLALARALLDDQLYEVADVPRLVQVLGVIPRDSPRGWWRRG